MFLKKLNEAILVIFCAVCAGVGRQEAEAGSGGF